MNTRDCREPLDNKLGIHEFVQNAILSSKSLEIHGQRLAKIEARKEWWQCGLHGHRCMQPLSPLSTHPLPPSDQEERNYSFGSCFQLRSVLFYARQAVTKSELKIIFFKKKL